MTKPEPSPANLLLQQFGQDSRDRENTVTEWKLQPLLLGVMAELAEIIGSQEPLICVGDITHNITDWAEAWEAENPRKLDMRPSPPWEPNDYYATVVTGKLIVNTWGTFSANRDAIRPEVTQIMTLKNMSGMSTLARPGDDRGDGTTATHHNIEIKFTDGSTFNLPDTHEELTQDGNVKMTALVPFLYERLSD